MALGRFSPGARVYLGALTGILVAATGFAAWIAIAPTGGEAAPTVAGAVVTVPPTTPPPPPPTTTSTTSTTTTTTTTTTVPAPPPPPPEPAKGYLTIHGVGDVALDPDYIGTFRREGYEYAWSGLDGLFTTDDLTVINLECTPSTQGSPLDKAFTFRCDPDALRPARAAGIEVANMANNHGADFGVPAMIDGRNRLLAAGIAPVGVGDDFAGAHRPVLFEIEGWRIAVLGFGGVIPSYGWLATEDRPGMASGDDTETMVAAVEAAAEVADIVIVTVHWGHELETTINAADRERGQALVEAGADIIFGHHQHRLNPLEWYEGRPIAWGLGNFVWPRLSTASATTAIARVVVSPDGVYEACLIPAFIVDGGHPVPTGPAPCGEPGALDPAAR